MQNGSGSGYMSQGMMNNRPPSPPRRSMGAPPMSHEWGSGGSYGNSHSPHGSSMSPHVQHSSPSHHFSQILHPQRSASSSNYNSVTREDFTLRGPSSAPAPRPSDARNDSRDSRNASSASSNPSLRNLLS
ncbi:hypothetical protein F503_02466 [Ophiostoma piceae UAMH 11346]|uniref:Uncharacterized protein n=1 Tax=Ophiostoma piceae (strain UAMH 11346) TaxID=1262450 RepID=S3CIW1_OPHP1|nr:hypothetical protein F503_02466 [Ophiostoma piceae UAMH 11346]